MKCKYSCRQAMAAMAVAAFAERNMCRVVAQMAAMVVRAETSSSLQRAI